MTDIQTEGAPPSAFGGEPFIDQREEIAANEIEVSVTMPGGQTHHLKIDASRYTSAIEVADEVGLMLQRLLEA